jgi:2-iminoacetate synthase ThiH
MEIIIDENTEPINHVNKIKDMQAEKNKQTNKRKQMISLSFHPNH